MSMCYELNLRADNLDLHARGKPSTMVSARAETDCPPAYFQDTFLDLSLRYILMGTHPKHQRKSLCGKALAAEQPKETNDKYTTRMSMCYELHLNARDARAR